MRRRRRVLLAVVAAAAVVTGGFAALHSSLLGVHRVAVAGPDPVGKDGLLQAAGIRRGEALLEVSTGRAGRRLEGLAWVRTASVHRQWPGTVRIVLTDRVAVAQVPTGRSRSGPVALVDVTGRVLGDLPAATAQFPVLVGAGPAVPVGRFMAGASGGFTASWRAALRAATRSPAAELALSAALDADHLAATTVEVARGGTVSAVIAGGATVVTFGTADDLDVKLAALTALARAGDLRHAAAVDLEVPSRPAVTASSGTSGVASTATTGQTGQG